MSRILYLLSALPCLVLPVAAASPTARAVPADPIVSRIDARLPGALDLLERTVNINSGTLNLEGVREVGAVFGKEFDALGFSTRWVDGEAWGRAGHLLAQRRGAREGPHFLFIGHLDTVFEIDSPFQEFRRIDADHAAGPGVIDMKGGIVVMLLALDALRETGALDRMTVTVVLTGDEEKPGKPLDLARRDLREAARRADYAIGFEDGDGDPATAVIARRGFSSWTLETTGNPAHSSQIFREDLGSGAIFEAARILAAWHEELSGEDLLTFNPGLIVGGTTVTYDREQARGSTFGKDNVIAETATVSGDLRTISSRQYERATLAMSRIARSSLPGTSARIVFHEGYPPLAPTRENRRILARFDRASRDLGHGKVRAVDPARAGAADVSFAAGLVKGAMDGAGLMGDGGHTVDEVADLRTLPVQARRMALMLSRWVAED